MANLCLIRSIVNYISEVLRTILCKQPGLELDEFEGSLRPLVKVSSRDRAEIPVMLMTICLLIDYPEIGPSVVYMFHPCMINPKLSPSSRQVQSILAATRAIQVVGSSAWPSRPLSGRCSYVGMR